MLKEMFVKYGEEYIETYKDNIPYAHIKVIEAIMGCGSSSSNTITTRCTECGDYQTHYCSCGNRNCPLCQYHKSQIWLEKRLKEQLPGPYYMVTFTVPEKVREFMRKSQADAYNIFFKAASETLKTFITDKKYTGAELAGFFGVLHTWGQQLQYHPHIHFIVPAGGLDKDKLWVKAPEKFLAPVYAMSKVFRGKFLELMKKEFDGFVTPDLYRQPWNVNSQYIKSGGKGAIKYLAPYVFKVAISKSRIISVENDIVTFKYIDKRTKEKKVMSLNVFEFIRRFLQHVLPSGFMKIRYYGFMSPACKITAKEIAVLIEIAYDYEVEMIEYKEPLESPPRLCEKCGGKLEVVAIKKNDFVILLE